MAALPLALAACQTTVPDSGAGVGFGDYESYAEQREAQLSGQAAPQSTYVAVGPLQPRSGPLTTPAIAAARAETEGQQDRVINTAGAQVPIVTTPVTAQNNPGISDEQDFSAVSSRETIESDRERLEAQREQYQVVQPTALPARSGEDGPNVVEYALSTSHAPGTQIYKRGGLSLGGNNALARKCSKYSSSDRAQQAFLKAGGPDRDRLGLDPDGDGYACFWDPRPFRAAVGN